MEQRNTTGGGSAPQSRGTPGGGDAARDRAGTGPGTGAGSAAAGGAGSAAAPTSTDTGLSADRTRREGGIVGRARDRATAQLSTQKDRATDGLGAIVQAFRQTSDRLRQDQHPTVAQYVDRATEQIERLSNRLREKNVDDLLRDAGNLARRQPGLVIGASFATGLIAARVLKSRRGQQGFRDTGTTAGAPGGYRGGYASPGGTGGTAGGAGAPGVPPAPGAPGA